MTRSYSLRHIAAHPAKLPSIPAAHSSHSSHSSHDSLASGRAKGADFLSGRGTLKTNAHLALKMEMNPDGHEIFDEAVLRNRHAEYIRKAKAAKREEFAAQIAEAAASGQDVVISTKAWIEIRSVEEGSSSGEFAFRCSRTEWVTPSGDFKSKETEVAFPEQWPASKTKPQSAPPSDAP